MSVVRIETRNTRGWQVRLQRRGVQQTRFFSDRPHGGIDAALEAARRYEQELLREMGEEGRPMVIAAKPGSSNPLAVPGFVLRTHREQEHLQVNWYPEPSGKPVRHQRSLGRHGFRRAVDELLRFRYHAMREIHGADFPYSDFQEYKHDALSRADKKEIRRLEREYPSEPVV